MLCFRQDRLEARYAEETSKNAFALGVTLRLLCAYGWISPVFRQLVRLDLHARLIIPVEVLAAVHQLYAAKCLAQDPAFER